MRFLVSVLWLVACAAPARPLAEAIHDLSQGDDLSQSDDLSQGGDLSQRGDLSHLDDLSSPPDLATLPDLAIGCEARLNEVATGTSASGLEEFVELYNPCDGPVSLAQHKLVYRAAAGSNDVVLVADLQVTLASGAFAVFAGGSYYASARQGAMSSGLAEAGGGVAVRAPGGAIVDSMGWGTASNAFVVASPAPAPGDKAAPGRSVARSPDGQAGASSAADFRLTDQPTPGAANVIH